MLASTRAAPCATRRSFALAPATAPSAPHVRRCSAAGPRAARQRRPHVLLRPAQAAADNAQAEAPPQPQEPPPEPETVFFEGNGGSSAELAISLILGLTLVYAPLTIASIGRRLWLKIKVTNKRIIITNDSPLFKREAQVSFAKIKEVRAAPRAFGAWGDMVIFLKDGSQIELLGMQDYAAIKAHIEKSIYTIRG